MSQTVPQDPLDVGEIRKSMAAASLSGLRQLTLLTQTDSTNTAILRMPGDSQHAHAVLADQQTGGRGRRQKSWHSPAGGNIYLSLGWWFRQCDWPLSTLPLVVAVAVCRALSRAGLQGHGIKWPNDIYSKDAKLAGVLVELSGEAAGPCQAIVGIGINIEMPDGAGPVLDQPWIDVQQLVDAKVSRNRLAVDLLDELVSTFGRYEAEGLAAFIDTWQDHDLLAGRLVELRFPHKIVRGNAGGIDMQGALLVEVQGEIQRFTSGDVSLRPA